MMSDCCTTSYSIVVVLVSVGVFIPFGEPLEDESLNFRFIGGLLRIAVEE